MRVVHDAEDIAEGIDHRSSGKALLAVGRRLVLNRAHCEQFLVGALEVVQVPIHDGTAGCGRRTGGCVAAIDDANLVLVIAGVKLDVGRRSGCWRADEVRLDAQQLGVPIRRRVEIRGPEADRSQSSPARRFVRRLTPLALQVRIRDSDIRRRCGTFDS